MVTNSLVIVPSKSRAYVPLPFPVEMRVQYGALIYLQPCLVSCGNLSELSSSIGQNTQCKGGEVYFGEQLRKFQSMFSRLKYRQQKVEGPGWKKAVSIMRARKQTARVWHRTPARTVVARKHGVKGGAGQGDTSFPITPAMTCLADQTPPPKIKSLPP